MILKRKDTLSLHNTSAREISCQTKYDQKKGKKSDIDFAKVDQTAVDRYNKLFSTAYVIAKNNKPYSDYALYCDFQIK